MYIPDLSPYPDNKEYHLLGTISVGWLDKRHPYLQGMTAEEFRDRLFIFCSHPVIKMRGFHSCEFCILKPSFLIRARRGHKEIWLGNAEIRVIHEDQVYSAPNLIYHYVVAHNYRPPEEFIEAVLKGPLPHTWKYERFKEKKKIDWW